MKYRVTYQSRSNGNVFSGSVEIESPIRPLVTDQALNELVLQDSTRFHKEGLGGVEVLTIIPIA